MDEGEGIRPPDLSKMFNQIHLCGVDEGHLKAGMQLAVCRGYTKAMGGTIRPAAQVG